MSKPEPRYVVHVVITEVQDAWSEPKKPNYPQDGMVHHDGSSRTVLDLTAGSVDEEGAITKAVRQLELERDES